MRVLFYAKLVDIPDALKEEWQEYCDNDIVQFRDAEVLYVVCGTIEMLQKVDLKAPDVREKFSDFFEEINNETIKTPAYRNEYADRVVEFGGDKARLFISRVMPSILKTIDRNSEIKR